MKILICQPKQELSLTQLEATLHDHLNIDLVLFPEGYIANKGLLKAVCKLAQEYAVAIITSYRDENRKDRALCIAKTGQVILDRAKTPMDGSLYGPSSFEYEGTRIGYLLCVELLQGLVGFQELGIEQLDLVVHPIGVGMFSEEQFDEWIAEAKKIAVAYQAMVVGTSHADGSFRNCGISIPIAYCIDRDGTAVFISHDDVRPVLLDTDRKSVKVSGPRCPLSR